MSVAFTDKLVEIEGDNWNPMASDVRSWRSRSSVCWIVAAAVCLGLLLLTMILVASNTSAINHWDTKYSNLISEIINDRDSLREERDQLKIHSSNLTQQMEFLQSQYDTVVARRDQLQGEVNSLNVKSTDKPCHQGWKKFNNRCYYVSPSGVSKTWANSRKDCQDRGADLAIIKTKAELDFVKKSYSVTWIGLSLGEGNKWRWVDGTELEGDGFWQQGEPNNVDGDENCVEVSRSAAAWNDVPCDRKFSFMCMD